MRTKYLLQWCRFTNNTLYHGAEKQLKTNLLLATEVSFYFRYSTSKTDCFNKIMTPQIFSTTIVQQEWAWWQIISTYSWNTNTQGLLLTRIKFNPSMNK